MTDKIRASTSTEYCIFCNKLVVHSKDEYSQTKRKTINWKGLDKMTSIEKVREATIDIYNMVTTQQRSKLEEKLEVIYKEVCVLDGMNKLLLERLQTSESERFN